MKLILTQEVTGLGAPGDVVEVKDGYGRNYLVPRGLAIRWTRGGEKTVESIKKARALACGPRPRPRRTRSRPSSRPRPVSVKVRAGEGGRLFGAVTVADIAGAITEAAGERGRQAHDRGRQPDQVAGRPPGHGQAARRGVRHGRPQRRRRLTQATWQHRERAAGRSPERPTALSACHGLNRFLRCPARRGRRVV